jgi:hypothetical protein
MTVKELLIPKYSHKLCLRRYGGRGDGGYVLSDTIMNDTSCCFSYGIGNNVKFDLAVVEAHRVKVFMYDHTVKNSPKKHKNFYFHKQPLKYDTFEQHLLDNGCLHTNDNLLKIDVEGCEYEFFANIPDELMLRFSQIALEIHGVKNTKEKSIALLQKILTNFTLVHMHGNNYGRCHDGLPEVLELTFVRNDLMPEDSRFVTSAYPLVHLDSPNNLGVRDYKLNWHLTVPTDNTKV